MSEFSQWQRFQVRGDEVLMVLEQPLGRCSECQARGQEPARAVVAVELRGSGYGDYPSGVCGEHGRSAELLAVWNGGGWLVARHWSEDPVGEEDHFVGYRRADYAVVRRHVEELADSGH